MIELRPPHFLGRADPVQEQDRRLGIGGVGRDADDSEAGQDVTHDAILAGPLAAR